ncbi:MAG TPA: hypothetical protein VMK16_02930 [Acidimicrobiales bacterium]|nr:hypothetical protein [Acidimicrobiales bacterium]
MPTGVAGHGLATLLGAAVLAVATSFSLSSCGGTQIDERTATRIPVERGASTTVVNAIPVGGRADEAFSGVDGFRIEPTSSDVTSSFVANLATLPDAVELTDSVGFRNVSAPTSEATDAIVVALALAPSDAARVSSLEQALLDGVAGGSPTQSITLGGQSAVLVDTVDENGEAFQIVFWRGNGIDLLVVGLVDDPLGVEKIAGAFIQANAH